MQTNPYAQAGWYNPQNPHSVNSISGSTSSTRPLAPSIFGALPYPNNQTYLPAVLSFHYVLLNPSVLNCAITGPTSIPFLDVTTSGQSTLFRKSDGKALAKIDWSSDPTVEIPMVVSRRSVSQWLPLSADRSRRQMSINGHDFAWIPVSNALCLFFAETPSKGYLVRIQRGNQSITMELTSEAFQLGLLETAIVATVILQSGRNLP